MRRQIFVLSVLVLVFGFSSSLARAGAASISGNWTGKASITIFDLASGFKLKRSLDLTIKISQPSGNETAIIEVTFPGQPPVTVVATVGDSDFVITTPDGKFTGTGHLSGASKNKMKGFLITVPPGNTFAEAAFTAKKLK